MIAASEFWKINGEPFAKLTNDAEPVGQMLHNVRLECRVCDIDRLTFTVSGRAIDALPLFDPGNAVIVTRDGQPFFAGKAIDPRLVGQPAAEDHHYAIVSAWYDLERVYYTQSWKVGGGTVQRPTLVLGCDVDGNLIKAAAVVADAIAFAIAAGVAIQAGTIDLDYYPPTDTVRAVTVGEVIRRMIRWSRDAVCWLDYSTSPPTINIVRRANLAAKSFAIGADTLPRVHDIDLIQRTDNVPAGVVIDYLIPATVDGQYVYDVHRDTAGATTGIGVIRPAIDLAPWSQTVIQQRIRTRKIDTSSNAWWALQVPAIFNNARIENRSDNVDGTDPTYGHEIISGQFAPWMTTDYGKHAIEETVYGFIAITVRADDGSSEDIDDLQVSTTIRSTDISADNVEYVFQKLTGFTAGDPLPPDGLAAQYLASLTPAQWEGHVRLNYLECPGDISCGNQLNLTGGKAAWASMNAQISQIDLDLDTGETEIVVGVARHLSVADLIDLANVARNRNSGLPSSFSLRTGESSGTNAADIPDGRATLNGLSAFGVTRNLKMVSPSDSSRSVSINPDDLPIGKVARFREVQVCVGGDLKTAYVIMTDPA
jgi:hypothetical protein